ncbi:hypothetical protein K435DRAFT_709018 [Dendrothele bispora CBS 962.96]|uniref:Large ribosomal subunit protein mL49 n=1 Tax=Dendrothele bispora (strain CBS 962.96) TaxID=1314807 RepID=A0A4S8MZA7_DENBC|nr:hypothetical protein K435DRAFT_709018 [Dendrothele bispora CBS 962.96]
MFFSLVRTASAPLRTRPQASYPYFVPRNSNGSLPVYSDIRNAGTRHLVLLRNIDGDPNALAQDLSQSLFASGTPESSKLKINVVRSKHLIISGGRWKNDVLEWLLRKGF